MNFDHMDPRHDDSGDSATAGPIHEVLDAERAAREAVAAAGKRAETMLEQARSAARRSQARADQRIARLHQRSRDTVTRRIAATAERAESEERRVRATQVSPQGLQAAIEDVARELSGGDGHDAESAAGEGESGR